MAIAVVVEEGAAGAPADAVLKEAGGLGDVGEGAVAMVAHEAVLTPEAAEEIVEAVVVVIADADAGLPAGESKTGVFRYVSEGSVAVVLVEVRSGSFAGRPLGVETVAVGEVDVEPAIVIEVVEGNAAAFGFDDGALVVYASPDVDGGEAGLLSYVNELDGREWGWGGGFDGLEEGGICPAMERSGQGFRERVSQEEEG